MELCNVSLDLTTLNAATKTFPPQGPSRTNAKGPQGLARGPACLAKGSMYGDGAPTRAN